MKTANHKKQITNKFQNPIIKMTKRVDFGRLIFLFFDNCDLFGISDLQFGISKDSPR
jgi:hypothetical protein